MKKKIDILDELTPAQLKSLEEGLRQADSGETIPHEVAMEIIRNKFKGLKQIGNGKNN